MDEQRIKREARRILKHGITSPGKARLTMNSLSFMIDDKEAQELARLLREQWQKWCELHPDFLERRKMVWNELAEKYGFKEANRILDERIDKGEI